MISEQGNTPSRVGDPGQSALTDQNPPFSHKTLRHSVEESLDNYFAELDGQIVNDLYDLFLSEVEAPLLEVVLKQTGNNQSKTASMLGLNRGTLRKKLKKYGLL
jgi:Fis family transcriptional regulator